jgi:hypothetical protein
MVTECADFYISVIAAVAGNEEATTIDTASKMTAVTDKPETEMNDGKRRSEGSDEAI